MSHHKIQDINYYWFSKAAEHDHADAKFNQGMMHFNGDGVKKDKAAAIKWFERAASHGSGNAGKILDLLRKKSRFR